MLVLKLCVSRNAGVLPLRRLLLLSSGCHRCLQLRSRPTRSSEHPWEFFRRNYSSVILKKDDGKTQTSEKAHLLEVLEARIQQLQADNVTEMQCTDVQFVNRINITTHENHTGSANLSFLPAREFDGSLNSNTAALREGRTVENQLGKKSCAETVHPKSTFAPKKWIEKLIKEKNNKTKRQLSVVKKSKECKNKNVYNAKKVEQGRKSSSNGNSKPKSYALSTLQAESQFSQDAILAEVEHLEKQSSNWDRTAKLCRKSCAETVHPQSTFAPKKWMEKLIKEKNNKTKWQLSVVKKTKECRNKNVYNAKKVEQGRESSSNGNSKPRKPKSSALSTLQAEPQFSQDAILAEVEHLEKQSINWDRTAKLLEDDEGNKYGDTQRHLLSYIEACGFNNDLDRAHQCVMYNHRALFRRKHLNVKTYSTLMHLWAKKGSLDQIGLLFSLVEEAELKPNLDCYVAALECMGRMENCAPHVIKRCIQQLNESGFKIQDMFKNCVFHKDEREMVMKAVRVVDPNFQPIFEPELHISQSPLVKSFYSEVGPVKYPKLDFSFAELKERFDRQLRKEQADTVSIDSVEITKPITEKMIKMVSFTHSGSIIEQHSIGTDS